MNESKRIKTNQNESNFNNLPQFTSIQWRYITARFDTKTDKEAAELIGLKGNTVAKWKNKREVDGYIKMATADRTRATIDILKAHTAEAAMVKVSGLRSDDEKIRQSVASEILDRDLGKATQRSEVDARVSWESELIDYIKNGKLTYEEVSTRLGDELARNLFTRAGITTGGS